ncbi:Uncharacterized protein TCAP_03084, partial [Tolypocladium capitatum]
CGFRSTPPPSTAADISLISTARSSPHRGYATDGAGADPRHPSGVVVTTAMRHESKPGAPVSGPADRGIRASGPRPGSDTKHAPSGASSELLVPESFSRPRTSIMGGQQPHQDVKYYSHYGRHSPC